MQSFVFPVPAMTRDGLALSPVLQSMFPRWVLFFRVFSLYPVIAHM